MTKLKKILKALLFSLLLLLPISWFLIATNSGLQLDLYIAQKLLANKLSIEKIKGSLINQPTLKNIEYQNESFQIKINHISLSWSLLKSIYQGINIDALSIEQIHLKIKKGSDNKSIQIKPKPNNSHSLTNIIQSISNLRFNLKNINIKQLSIISDAQKININNLQLTAQANQQGLVINQFKLRLAQQTITSTAELSFMPKHQLNLAINSQGLIHSQTNCLGDIEKYHCQTRISKPFKSLFKLSFNQELNFDSSLTLKHGFWPLTGEKSAFINNLNFQMTGTPLKFNAQGQGQLKLADNLTTQLVTLKFDKNNHNFNLDLNYGNNHLKVNKANQLFIDLNIPNLATLNSQLSHINTSIKLKGQLNKEATLYIGPGNISLTKKQNLNFDGGVIKIKNQHQQLKANGKLVIDNKNHLNLNISLPHFGSMPLNQQRILATLNLSLKNLNIIDKLIEDLQHSQGQLIGKLTIDGNLLKPKVSSQLKLTQASTHITALASTLKDINLSLNGTPANYALQGKLYSGSGKLNIDGSVQLNKETLKTKLALTGNNLTLFNTDEYKIDISPTLILSSENNRLFLKGKIKIPHAVIKPHDFSSSQELPDDVEIIGQKKQRSKSLQIAYNAQISLGEDIQLSVMGLSGKLTGNLTIDAPFDQMTKATGSLKILDGKYDAYGQHLVISNGQLIYSGGPLNNPGIFIEATRSFNYESQYAPTPSQSFDSSHMNTNDFSDKMTVGLQVSGRLKSPKVQLFSNPSTQNQADILSMLILGRPTSQASSEADSQLLLSALSSLDLGGGASGQQLTSQLQHAFGLDNLGIETQSTYNAETDTTSENTALVIGKSLTSKLSINYSIGFGQGTNILRVKYKFSPSWAIQTESDGTASGVDIIYNYQKK